MVNQTSSNKPIHHSFTIHSPFVLRFNLTPKDRKRPGLVDIKESSVAESCSEFKGDSQIHQKSFVKPEFGKIFGCKQQ